MPELISDPFPALTVVLPKTDTVGTNGLFTVMVIGLLTADNTGPHAPDVLITAVKTSPLLIALVV